ncbi:tyrosine-type recombinase/integrase [Halomonas sp. LS-001]
MNRFPGTKADIPPDNHALTTDWLPGQLPHGRELRITARHDAEAVAQWLNEYLSSPQTLRAYQREAQRLLLWLGHQKMNLEDVDREVLGNFEEFLADPQPRTYWVGPLKPRHHPQWKPFRGPLSATSRRQSLIILQGMFSWLVEAGWVAHNPFRLMRDKSRRLNNQAPRIERYLEQRLWNWLWAWLHRDTDHRPRQRFEAERLRIIFAFAYLLAPRISEMAGATMGDIYLREGRWWWQVVGKGAKLAQIPVPDDFMHHLARWRTTLGLPAEPLFQEEAPLLRSLNGQRGIGENQLYRLIRKTFQDAALALEQENGPPAQVAALRSATPHWLRHTAITHQAQAGINLRYLAESARHARLETTSRYLHNEDEQWHDEQQRHRLSSTSRE